MKNYHIIKVKYLGSTNFKGSRVKLTSDRFNQSVTIPYNYEFNSSYDMAADWLLKHGFEVIGGGEVKGIHIIITNTFEPLKKEV